MGGQQVGTVVRAFLGAEDGQPEWILARMGRFGHYCLVPARDAVTANERIWVPYDRDQIRRAPRVDQSDPLAQGVEEAVLDHYGLGPPPVRSGGPADGEAGDEAPGLAEADQAS